MILFCVSGWVCMLIGMLCSGLLMVGGGVGVWVNIMFGIYRNRIRLERCCIVIFKKRGLLCGLV